MRAHVMGFDRELAEDGIDYVVRNITILPKLVS
jgi:hypothetical protein